MVQGLARAQENTFTVDNFLSNAILGAITGKLGQLISKGANAVINHAGDLAESTINNIFGAATDLTVGK